MSNFACWGKNEILLMPETAKGYYSGFKYFLVWKFRGDKREIPIFRTAIWKKYLDAMWKRKVRLHNQMGLAMNNPKNMIPDNHREVIAKICIWNADAGSAAFMALNASLFHHAARTIESSSLRKTDMKIIEENSGTKRMKVFSNLISRSKIGQGLETIRTYPHKDSLLRCYHFALAYSFIMNR